MILLYFLRKNHLLLRGKVEIPLSDLTPSESKDFWAPVDTVGELHLELTYFPIG